MEHFTIEDIQETERDAEARGYNKALKDLREFTEEKLDLRFALDILTKEVIDEFIEEAGGENAEVNTGQSEDCSARK